MSSVHYTALYGVVCSGPATMESIGIAAATAAALRKSKLVNLQRCSNCSSILSVPMGYGMQMMFCIQYI